MAEELKDIEKHEIEERRRGQLYLAGFAVVLVIVVIGLALAFGWIGNTVH